MSSNSNKILFAIMAILVIGLIMLVLGTSRQSRLGFTSPSNTADQNKQNGNNNQQKIVNNPTDNSQLPVSDNQNYTTITFNDGGFSPTAVSIARGGTIMFVNRGSHPVWPASDPHPAHSSYPVRGGCVDSAFDACRALSPNESWIFTFTVSGNWDYHNHLDPSERGTVSVK